MKTKLILASIIGLALVLRLVGLAHFPTGLTPDEAAQGYTAYSLLQTGKDEWGVPWPLSPRSFGDYKAPLYTYALIPSVSIFGLNEFAVRLPAALFGVVAVIFTYMLTNKLTNNKSIALTAMGLLAISPWHMALSRGGFEANLTTCFLTAGAYFLLRSIDQAQYLYLATLFFVLNMFSYHAARVATPLIIGILLIWQPSGFFRRGKHSIAAYVICLVIFVSAFVIASVGGSTRAGDVAIFHPTDQWAAVSDRRYEAVLAGIPDKIAQIFSNKITYTWSTFIDNYLSYFSIDYLFLNGPGEGTYGMIPGRGVLYLIEIITIGYALYLFIKGKSKTVGLMCLWIAAAAIPAALAKGYHAANRDAIAMPAWQIMSAIGFTGIWNANRISQIAYRMRMIILGGVLLVSVCFFLEDYFVHAPVGNAQAMRYGWPQAIEYIKEHGQEYNQIVISRRFSEPQAYVAFYLPVAPQIFQQAAPNLLEYDKDGRHFLDQLGEYKIDKYVFREIAYGEKLEPHTLYIGTFDETHDRKEIFKQVNYPNRKPAFVFMKAEAQP